MAQRKFSNQDIIKELRSFMKERDEWKADFNKPEIRNVISKLFGLKKSHVTSSPTDFALALVRSDLNAICCIPSLYWEWIKDEADRLMTLQRVAGTYPHNTDGVHFCLVALEGCELVGWQPLAILLAAGVRVIHGHTGDYDGDCLYLTFLDEKGKELDIDDNWDIPDWLISSSSIEGTKALHITCDILKMKIVCGGDMVVTRAFEGCINIAQTGKMAYSLDSLITQKHKVFHK
jgi:hypothetical protein